MDLNEENDNQLQYGTFLTIYAEYTDVVVFDDAWHDCAGSVGTDVQVAVVWHQLIALLNYDDSIETAAPAA